MQRLPLSLITSSIAILTVSTNALAAAQYQPASWESPSSLIAEATATNGQFVAVEHPTQGQVSVIEEDGAKYLEIGQVPCRKTTGLA
jgi:hypothetical protein